MSTADQATRRVTVAPPRAEQLVVASVPSGHVYVRHLSPEHGPGARRLPDPDPGAPTRAATERWWPPVMLQPDWAAQADFDVFHLHFGFDACDPADLQRLMAVLHDRGKPFVFTVHDLRNPHHRASELHDEQLDVLVPAADRLVTLTHGAAAEISRRWGREAQVLAHPHVVDFATMGVVQDDRARRRTMPFRVGLHVKSLRASMDPMQVLPTLIETVTSLPDAVLQVDGHRDVLDDDGLRRDDGLARYLDEEAARGRLDLRVHDYFTDDELWGYLASLDVSVLPYRFGTHSGWLEACRDLGTTVVAPTCGYFADQGAVLQYRLDEAAYDPDTLASAVETAYRTRPRLGASIGERRTQRREVSAAHEALYRSLVG